MRFSAVALRRPLLTFLILTGVALTLSLAACGSKGKKNSPKNDNSGNGGDPTAQLTSEDRAQFEKWQQAIVKSCDAAEIFPDGTDTQTQGTSNGIDTQALASKLGGTTLLADEFVVLQSPEPLTGTQQTEINRQLTAHDNQVYTLQAKTERDGSLCKVYLFGKLAHTTKIQARLQFSAFTAQSLEQAIKSTPRLTAHRSAVTGEDHQLFYALQESFLPRGEDAAVKLATALELPEGASHHFIPSYLDLAMTVDLGDQLAPIGTSDPLLMGDELTVRAAMETEGTVSATYYLRPAKWLLEDELLNTEDEDLWVWRVTFQRTKLAPTNANDLPSFELKLTGIERQSDLTLSDELTADCLDRRGAILPSITTARGQFSPAIGELVGPCSKFSPNLVDGWIQNERLRKTLMAKFSGVTGGEHDYYGWEAELLEVGKKIVTNGATIQESLDPDGRSPLVKRFSDEAKLLVGLASAHTHLSDLSAELVRLGGRWALTSKDVLDGYREKIVAVAAKTHPNLSRSLKTLLVDIGYDAEEHDATLQYAFDLDQTVVDRVQSTRDKAETLFAMEWIDGRLGSFLQQKLGEANLNGWDATLAAAEAFRGRELGRLGDESRFRHDPKFKELMSIALEDSWTATTFELAEKIAAFAVNKSMCDNYKDVTLRLDCVGFDKFRNTTSSFLYPQFGERYGVLASQFQSHLEKLGEDYFPIDHSLKSDFFDPIWHKCDNDQFNGKATALAAEIDNLVNTEDFVERLRIDRRIRELLRSRCE